MFWSQPKEPKQDQKGVDGFDTKAVNTILSVSNNKLSIRELKDIVASLEDIRIRSDNKKFDIYLKDGYYLSVDNGKTQIIKG